MPGSYTRRGATAEEYDFLYRLHVAAMKTYVAQTWGWDEALQSAMFREHFDPSSVEILVVDGHDIGALSVQRRDDEIFISNIEILPDWQSQGLGTAIIQDILREAQARGVSVRLQVLKVNPARRLYERLDFVVTGETATHYLMKAAGR